MIQHVYCFISIQAIGYDFDYDELHRFVLIYYQTLKLLKVYAFNPCICIF